MKPWGRNVARPLPGTGSDMNLEACPGGKHLLCSRRLGVMVFLTMQETGSMEAAPRARSILGSTASLCVRRGQDSTLMELSHPES